MRRFLVTVLMTLLSVTLPLHITGGRADAQSVETVQEIAEWRGAYDAIVLDAHSLSQELDQADYLINDFDLGTVSPKEAHKRLDQLQRQIMASGDTIAQRFDTLPALSAEALSYAVYLPKMAELTRQTVIESNQSTIDLLNLYRAYIDSGGEGAEDKLLVASLKRLLPPIELENQMIQLTLDESPDRGTPNRSLSRLSIYTNEVMLHFLQGEINHLLGTGSDADYHAAIAILDVADDEIADGHLRTSQTLDKLGQLSSDVTPQERAFLRSARNAFATFSDSLETETKLFDALRNLMALQADNMNSLDHPDREQLLLEVDQLTVERVTLNAQRVQMIQ